MPWHTRTSSH